MARQSDYETGRLYRQGDYVYTYLEVTLTLPRLMQKKVLTPPTPRSTSGATCVLRHSRLSNTTRGISHWNRGREGGREEGREGGGEGEIKGVR